MAHSFEGFHSQQNGPIALGLWRHSTSSWEHMVAEEAHSFHGGQKVKKEKRKGRGPNILFRGHVSSDLSCYHQALPLKNSITSQ